jgi:hypothetical protein
VFLKLEEVSKAIGRGGHNIKLGFINRVSLMLLEKAMLRPVRMMM